MLYIKKKKGKQNWNLGGGPNNLCSRCTCNLILIFIFVIVYSLWSDKFKLSEQLILSQIINAQTEIRSLLAQFHVAPENQLIC